MHWIIEVAADAGAADAHRFGGQIEDLADGAAFPKEARIKPGIEFSLRALKIGDHAEAEAAVGCYCLLAR